MQTKTHHGSLCTIHQSIECIKLMTAVPHERFIWPKSEISIIDVIEEFEVVDDLDGQWNCAQYECSKVSPCNNLTRGERANRITVLEERSDLEPGYPVVDPRRYVQQSGGAGKIPSVAVEAHEAEGPVRHGQQQLYER